MVKYIMQRVFVYLLVLFGITVLSFFIIHLAPGSPLEMMIDPNTSQSTIEAKRAAMGLNDPLYVQYIIWLKSVFSGNLGYSMTTNQPVARMIGERMGPTLLLMGTSLLLGLFIAIPVGTVTAVKRYSKLDYIATTASMVSISLPNFFLGLGLVYLFSLVLKWLPSGGMNTLGESGNFIDALRHLILPVIVLGTGVAGVLVRYVRSAMLEVLEQDYLRTARAKGVRDFVVIYKHALRNALSSIITITGLQVAGLLGGSVVTEQIFSWPGLGRLTYESVMARDYTTIMGINLVSAVVVLAVNLLTDVAYTIVDPRINTGEK